MQIELIPGALDTDIGLHGTAISPASVDRGQVQILLVTLPVTLIFTQDETKQTPNLLM